MYKSKVLLMLTLLVFLWGMEGCSLLEEKLFPPSAPKKVAVKKRTQSKRTPRRRVSVRRNLYEGSLWRDESSFGNLWRDHRARFRNDLLTINEVNKIISVPEPKKKKEPGNAGTDIEKAAALLEAVTLKDTIEEEQNDILRSLDTMSAEVVRVLPNGNMLVRGQRIDHRQNNQIRYMTTVTGILRPADVDDSNIVSATKLVYPELKIKRQILGSLLRERINKLSPLMGKQRAGFLERLSDFAKNPSAKGGTTTVK